MKKIAKIITFAICLALSCVLWACGHTHTFSDEWVSNDTHHWHEATCEHDTEVSGKAEHEWNSGVETTVATCAQAGVKTFTCTDCERTKTEPIPKLNTHDYSGGLTKFVVEDGVLYTQKVCDICQAGGDKTQTLNGVVASTAQQAQDALDNAVKGTVIYLDGEINYGTLYIRPNPGNANTETTDTTPVYSVEYIRSVEDLTVVGKDGATVDGFVFESGARPDPAQNSLGINDLLVFIKAKNITFENVTFTSAGGNTLNGALNGNSIMVYLTHVELDGLTVKDCTLTDDGDSMLLYLYGANSTKKPKNVTITGCTVDGALRCAELRGVENVTITNNTVKNTVEHNFLLAGVSEHPYAGTITISDNVSMGSNERFIRADYVGEATVIITDNTVTNYKGADDDYIKITNFTGESTVSNNTATPEDTSRTLTINLPN